VRRGRAARETGDAAAVLRKADRKEYTRKAVTLCGGAIKSWMIMRCMIRHLLMFAGALAVSANLYAQNPDIDTPLLAAPANQRDATTVIKWKPDLTYDTLRKGTNRLVCYDRSGQPGQPAFSLECTSVANLERVAQNMKFEAMGDKKQAMLDAAEKDGTRVKPEFGSVFYNLSGADRERARSHTTIAVPFATAQSMALPDNNKQGGAWIMNAGTSTAHVMIPGF
jgi:hypothetical protein